MVTRVVMAMEGWLLSAVDKWQPATEWQQGLPLPSWPSKLLVLRRNPFMLGEKALLRQQASHVQLARKLGGLERLASVAVRLLVHIQDEVSGKRFLVDTGASYSIQP